MGLGKKLKGVPFSNIFTIDKVGLEYEIELAFFHDSFTPERCGVITCNINNIKQFIGDQIELGLVKFLKNNWALCRYLDKDYTLYIDYSLIKSLMTRYNYLKYTPGKKAYNNDDVVKTFNVIIDEGVSNFEIRTHPHKVFQNAVNEAQHKYEILVKILLELKIPRFVLLTPGFRTTPNSAGNTKHLNITLVNQNKKLVQKWLNSNYPFYFRKSLGEISNLSFRDTDRIHLKLPYKFKDYDKFLNGTLKLPNLNRVYEYQEDIRKKEGSCSKDLDYKNCELVVLGYQAGSKWISCNNLV